VRTGNPGFGKLTAEIRAWVPEDTDEGIVALAARAGVPKGAYVRAVLMCHVHGHVSVASLREEVALSSAVTAR
jgi:hypothetical protein